MDDQNTLKRMVKKESKHRILLKNQIILYENENKHLLSQYEALKQKNALLKRQISNIQKVFISKENE